MGAVAAALDRHAAELDNASRLLVGFSGGLDSTVLLHALVRRCPGRVLALHANHALQADAGHWQRHCDDYCRALDVPLQSCELQIVDDGQGTEAAARSARYSWFEHSLAPGDLLLLAHHQDDQAETLLLRLLRGAGPEGLAGMPVRRALGAGRLLRPLLPLPRRLLAEYAAAQRLPWVEDPSNARSDQDRNYLRHEVLPLLERRWPGYRRTFSRAAGLLGELAMQVPAAPLECCESVVGDPGFRLDGLPADVGIAARAVRGWLRDAGLRMPSAAMLTEFLRQLGEGRGARLETADWVLERYRDAVYCYPPGLAEPPPERAVVTGAWIPWPGAGRIRVGGSVADDDLLLRCRRGGERLATAAGRHRDLKTVFQAAAVPPWWRPRMPLLWRRRGQVEELLAVGACARSPAAEDAGLALYWDAPTMPSRGHPR